MGKVSMSGISWFICYLFGFGYSGRVSCSKYKNSFEYQINEGLRRTQWSSYDLLVGLCPGSQSDLCVIVKQIYTRSHIYPCIQDAILLYVSKLQERNCWNPKKIDDKQFVILVGELQGNLSYYYRLNPHPLDLFISVSNKLEKSVYSSKLSSITGKSRNLVEDKREIR